MATPMKMLWPNNLAWHTWSVASPWEILEDLMLSAITTSSCSTRLIFTAQLEKSALETITLDGA